MRFPGHARSHLEEEPVERRHRDRRAVGAAAARRRLGAGPCRIRMVGVDVEPRPRRTHRANEGDRGHAAGVPARRGDAACDPVAPVHALERPVGRVEQPHHVRPRRDRAQPAPLVRLVPDRPVAHPRVAARGRDGEVREVGAARRRDLPRAAAVRPARRSEQGDDSADTARAAGRRARRRTGSSRRPGPRPGAGSSDAASRPGPSGSSSGRRPPRGGRACRGGRRACRARTTSQASS